MRLFLTGHTGFKGSWFTLCAARAGIEVFGYSLEPVEAGFFEQADIAARCSRHTVADIRDISRLRAAVESAQPDVVVHMAAQPLVRRSYREPRETFDVNVIGTLNVLEAVAQVDTVERMLVVTSDKVYRNTGATDGYTEDAPLGGHDPYSASKAMCEILVSSWALSYPVRGRSLNTARAGNVIGGGDRCEDRLLPDILRGISAGESVVLRNPNAVRPWQHVLDVTSGYLAVLRHMSQWESPQAWNLGPDPADKLTVRELAEIAVLHWGSGSVSVDVAGQPHEAAMLTLDASRAAVDLGWTPLLDARAAVEWTIDWEREVRDGAAASTVAESQIANYEQKRSESSLILA